MIYDGFILMALSFAYGAILTAIAGSISSTPNGDYQPMLSHPMVFVGWLLVLCTFYGWFWLRCGQTVGMRAWRLKLVHTPPQTPLQFKHVVLRMLVGIPSTLLFGLGYWYQWVNKERLCLHDQYSSTAVVVLPKPDKKP